MFVLVAVCYRLFRRKGVPVVTVLKKLSRSVPPLENAPVGDTSIARPTPSVRLCAPKHINTFNVQLSMLALSPSAFMEIMCTISDSY